MYLLYESEVTSSHMLVNPKFPSVNPLQATTALSQIFIILNGFKRDFRPFVEFQPEQPHARAPTARAILGDPKSFSSRSNARTNSKTPHYHVILNRNRKNAGQCTTCI